MTGTPKPVENHGNKTTPNDPKPAGEVGEANPQIGGTTTESTPTNKPVA